MSGLPPPGRIPHQYWFHPFQSRFSPGRRERVLTGAQRVTSFHSSKYDERLVASLRKGRAPGSLRSLRRGQQSQCGGQAPASPANSAGAARRSAQPPCSAELSRGAWQGLAAALHLVWTTGKWSWSEGECLARGHAVPEAKPHLRTCRGEERMEPENLLGGSDVRTSVCTWCSYGVDPMCGPITSPCHGSQDYFSFQ